MPENKCLYSAAFSQFNVFMNFSLNYSLNIHEAHESSVRYLVFQIQLLSFFHVFLWMLGV